MPGIVYVVDDDASFRTAVERRLTIAGYRVVPFPSAQDLLDYRPDDDKAGCILLDVRIPGLSGPDLQERLAGLGSTLPIVFITGHADVPTTVRTIKAGADDFLTKPISSEQLLHSVGQAVSRHEAARRQRQKLDVLRDMVATLTPANVRCLIVSCRVPPTSKLRISSEQRNVPSRRTGNGSWKK